MPNSKIEFVRDNRLVKELILVNGPPRAGKAMLGPIMGGFARVEIYRIEYILDAIAVFYVFGKIERDVAIAILRREIDLKLYNSMISRMINFRFTDHGGVINNANPLRYFKRLFFKDGAAVVKRIKDEKPIFQVQSHNIVENIDLYLDAFGDGLRILDMVRHPIDRVYSMNKRGDGTEIGVNPRFMSLTIKYKGECLPWYAIGWEDEYLKDSPIDRQIKIAQSLNKKRIDKLKLLSPAQKNQILVIPYEKFATSPDQYLKTIESFINSEMTKHINKILRKKKIPMKINPEDRVKKLKTIKEIASNECLEILDGLSEEYEALYLR
tara:strand:+ start:1366 stop:2337 length:972 start_codon:yes stop_codon:yes gene_type:complete